MENPKDYSKNQLISKILLYLKSSDINEEELFKLKRKELIDIYNQILSNIRTSLYKHEHENYMNDIDESQELRKTGSQFDFEKDLLFSKGISLEIQANEKIFQSTCKVKTGTLFRFSSKLNQPQTQSQIEKTRIGLGNLGGSLNNEGKTEMPIKKLTFNTIKKFPKNIISEEESEMGNEEKERRRGNEEKEISEKEKKEIVQTSFNQYVYSNNKKRRGNLHFDFINQIKNNIIKNNNNDKVKSMSNSRILSRSIKINKRKIKPIPSQVIGDDYKTETITNNSNTLNAQALENNFANSTNINSYTNRTFEDIKEIEEHHENDITIEEDNIMINSLYKTIYKPNQAQTKTDFHEFDWKTQKDNMIITNEKCTNGRIKSKNSDDNELKSKNNFIMYNNTFPCAYDKYNNLKLGSSNKNQSGFYKKTDISSQISNDIHSHQSSKNMEYSKKSLFDYYKYSFKSNFLNTSEDNKSTNQRFGNKEGLLKERKSIKNSNQRQEEKENADYSNRNLNESWIKVNNSISHKDDSQQSQEKSENLINTQDRRQEQRHTQENCNLDSMNDGRNDNTDDNNNFLCYSTLFSFALISGIYLGINHLISIDMERIVLFLKQILNGGNIAYILAFIIVFIIFIRLLKYLKIVN